MKVITAGSPVTIYKKDGKKERVNRASMYIAADGTNDTKAPEDDFYSAAIGGNIGATMVNAAAQAQAKKKRKFGQKIKNAIQNAPSGGFIDNLKQKISGLGSNATNAANQDVNAIANQANSYIAPTTTPTGMSKGAKVGIVVGIVAVVGIAIFFIVKKHSKK